MGKQEGHPCCHSDSCPCVEAHLLKQRAAKSGLIIAEAGALDPMQSCCGDWETRVEYSFT